MVEYRRFIKKFTITPTSSAVLDTEIMDNSGSVASIEKILNIEIELLNKNSDGSYDFQIIEVQQFTTT